VDKWQQRRAEDAPERQPAGIPSAISDRGCALCGAAVPASARGATTQRGWVPVYRSGTSYVSHLVCPDCAREEPDFDERLGGSLKPQE
jgi:hypothetical protein